MPFDIQSAGAGIASQAAGGLLGLAFGNAQDNRQIKQQERLNELQLKAQKEMSMFNIGQQKDLWEYTGYANQVRQMKEAGLNPALLYGQAGGSGSTAAAAQGNVSAQSAPKGTGQEVQQFMGLAQQQQAQTALLRAQKENIEADTANKKEDTANINVNTKVQGATLENIAQETTNLKVKETILKLDRDLKDLDKQVSEGTMFDRMKLIDLAAQQAQQTLFQLQNQTEISDETKETVIKQATATLSNTLIDTQLKMSGIELNTQNIQRLKDMTSNELLNIALHGADTSANVQFKHDLSNLLQEESKLTGKQTKWYEAERLLRAVTDIGGKLIPSGLSKLNKVTPVRGFMR